MKRKQKKLLTQEEEERQRLKSSIFCLIVLIIAMSGYMYEGVFTYHPDKSLVPNIINLITGENIIIDDANCYPNTGVPLPVTPYDIKPNLVWSGWMLMLALFIPLFIISVTGVKVEKITKEKIRLKINEIKESVGR